MADQRYDGKTFGEWIELLRDPSPLIRRDAARALRMFGPPAIPVVVEALKDRNETVCAEAARTLGEIGPASVPALTAALGGPHPQARVYAARTLGEIGQAASSAGPALIESLQDPNARFRRLAGEALLNVWPRERPARTSGGVLIGVLFGAILSVSLLMAFGQIRWHRYGLVARIPATPTPVFTSREPEPR